MSLVLSTPTTSAVVRFLLDRLDDDYREVERDSRAHRGEPDRYADSPLMRADRLRAEIIAKWHVIGDLQQLLILRDQPFERPVREMASSALRAMTAPYETHRSYRREWRLS